MIIFIFALCILSIYHLGFSRKNINYLGKEQTTSVKGVFIILVFLSHIKGYLNLNNTSVLDNSFSILIGLIGQCMVAMFFVYSGLGVMESYKNKPNYKDGFLKKRVLTTWIHFIMAVIIFFIISFITDSTYSVYDYVLCWVGWTSIGNSNWYIFVILVLYIITYVAFMLSKKQKAVLLTTTIGTVALVAALRISGKESWWYDTAICYPLGMTVSIYRSNIEKTLDNNRKYYIFLVSSIVLFTLCKVLGNYFYYLSIPFFSIVLVMITYKVKIGNKALQWFGNHLFELYILQRIPMIILNGYIRNNYLYVIICFGVTCVLSVFFRKITKCLDSKILI